LQKTFELDLSALPQHEQKLANRELHDLHKKIEKQKPKKSFALKKRTKLAPKVEEQKSNEIVSNENKIELIPIYSNLKNETKVYQTESSDASLLIKNVENCKITINGPCSSFTLENAISCSIVMNDVTYGAAMVRDSSKCETILTSRQLRIKNCHDSTLKVSVCSKIALEESTGLKFGRNPNEKEHEAKMAEKGMTIMNNSFKQINDFEWPDTSTPSPNWSALL